MLTQFLNDPVSAYYWLVGLLIAITFHEAAHAYVADRLGDLTPRYQGRLTLNPLAHLDPIGTLLIFLAGFGWGKPVMFNPLSLRNPALGATLISLAGPVTNFIIATIFAVLIRTGVAPTALWAQIALINIVLGVFNLIPIAPLDGEKVVSGLLPHELRLEWARLQQFGIIILVVIIFTGGPIISGLVNSVFRFLIG